jgi:hypothetical protein
MHLYAGLNNALAVNAYITIIKMAWLPLPGHFYYSGSDVQGVPFLFEKEKGDCCFQNELVDSGV